jgi:hypothetical protein
LGGLKAISQISADDGRYLREFDFEGTRYKSFKDLRGFSYDVARDEFIYLFPCTRALRLVYDQFHVHCKRC